MITISVILFLLLLCGCINCTNHTFAGTSYKKRASRGMYNPEKT